MGSLELCGAEAVSENFISIGFSGESAASEAFPLCRETSVEEMLI